LDPMSKRFGRRGDVIVREIAGETVLVRVAQTVADAETAFCTGEVGRFVFERIGAGASLAEARDAVVAEFEVEARPAERDLMVFVSQLRDAGLIEEASGDALPSRIG
jgi:hypothetical protein